MAQNVNPTSSRIHEQVDKDSKNRSSGAATQQVSKRLQSELMSLMMSGDKGISAFPDGDNLLSWIGTVEGPLDSVYEGLKYKLRLEFPAGLYVATKIIGTVLPNNKCFLYHYLRFVQVTLTSHRR